MAYNIRNIDYVGLQKRKYFFDTNLWLKILKPPFTLSSKDYKYLNFFQKFRNDPNHPKIVVTSLLLSEVINRYLRDVSYPIFCKHEKVVTPPKSYYKEVYRNSVQFLTDYVSLCEDIKAFQNLYELIPDGLGTDIKQRDILTSPPQSLDFNDHYYYKLALKHGYIIVTDDKDFFVQEVEVLTYNTQLLERAKNAVQIKKP